MRRSMSVKVKMTIDGKEIICEPNLTVLDAARENNIEIPTICYNPLYDEHRAGSCRMCLVEVLSGGRPGLQPSCTLPVSSGLSVSTNSEAVYESRRTSMELIVSEHIPDCRNCPKSGDCVIARYCRDYDIDGVPVCAECPNQKEACYLSRGILCMGPITYANCGAYCTRRGYPCEGCHTVIRNRDILRFGLEAYKKAGFTAEEILKGAKVFSFDSIERIEEVMKDVGMR